MVYDTPICLLGSDAPEPYAVCSYPFVDVGFCAPVTKWMTIMTQHARDSPVSTGSPCVKEKFTIHNLPDLTENSYNHKTIVFSHVPSQQPQTYLWRTTMKGTYTFGRNRKKVPRETIMSAHLNIFSILVRCHDLYHKMGNVCRNGLLGDMFNERAKLHWQPLFALSERKGVSTQLHMSNDNSQLPGPRTFFFPTNELQSMLTPWLTMEISR